MLLREIVLHQKSHFSRIWDSEQFHAPAVKLGTKAHFRIYPEAVGKTVFQLLTPFTACPQNGNATLAFCWNP